MLPPEPWSVMLQNLRPSPCDPRCPQRYEVPIQAGAPPGNVVAIVYASWSGTLEESKAECLDMARRMAAAPALLSRLRAAVQALRSYQYGNASPDLAEEIADAADKLIAEVEGR